MCPGAGLDAERRCLLRQVEYAVQAAVDVVQIRERDLAAAELASLVRDAVAIARGTRTRVIVNDRLDVALACGAWGVHLRGDSMPPAVVRPSVPPGFMVGASVRSVEAAVGAAPHVDYLLAGTVWHSASKDGPAALLGLDGLRAIVRAVRIPVVAIGGVSPDRFDALREAGAGGAAGIGLFMGPLGAGRETSPCRAVPLLGLEKRSPQS